MLIRILALLFFFLTAQCVSADASDHPLLGRYPGSEIKAYIYTEYETLGMPVLSLRPCQVRAI